jgi:hypothetical protein
VTSQQAITLGSQWRCICAEQSRPRDIQCAAMFAIFVFAASELNQFQNYKHDDATIFSRHDTTSACIGHDTQNRDYYVMADDSDVLVQYFGILRRAPCFSLFRTYLDFTTMSFFFIVAHIFLLFYPVDGNYRGEYTLISFC